MRLIVLLIIVQHILATQSDDGLQLNGDTFAAGINSFSLRFTKILNNTGNIIFSPLGLAMSVGMILNGAEGETSNSLFKTLNMSQFSNKNDIHSHFKALLDEYKEMDSRASNRRKATVEVSNLAVAAEGYNLSTSFRNALKSFYDANVDTESFATNGEQVKDKLNKFVKEKTHDLIPQVFKQPLDPNTVMLLLNTIYFKDIWIKKFESELTKNSNFFNADGTESTVKMMTRYSEPYKYTQSAAMKAALIELQYEGNFSMIVILPDEKYGLAQIIENLNNDELESIITNMTYTEMNVYMPMFTFEYQIDLVAQFPKLGVNLTNAMTAMDSSLQITTAFHKAKIQVHESGTEAAAVTAIIADRIGGAADPIDFKCDHSFAFFIRDMNSNVNLFTGVVNKLK